MTLSCTFKDFNDGTILSSCSDFEYLHGEGELLPVIEGALDRKSLNDKIELVLSEDTFGTFDDELVLVEDQSLFPYDLEIGTNLELIGEDFFLIEESPHLNSKGGDAFLRNQRNDVEKLIYRVTDIDSGKVVLDGNHPFSSLNILLQIVVKNIS